VNSRAPVLLRSGAVRGCALRQAQAQILFEVRAPK
jgi:hypothetical protein